ncbi:MAG: 16S rRNA (adenine(1518)-N(6)/adenine(1519)-N(6))-dimethyltransferase RsmA [Spirochaetia bacterium]|nr:16S rRNA (adenine(1518)-N(6)/adenine(1519)-N(6))-dimethyltransferase RsmA [Spirochaetia bacterium]
MENKKFRYKKGLGQNFLHNTSKLGQMASLIDAKPGELIVEIGPGAGALTKLLCATGAAVKAVEIDTEAINRLTEKIGRPENLEIINSDFLEVDVASITNGKKAKFVGNIPYYITTPIVEKLVENRQYVSKVFLTVQREVAERMAASEGSKTYGSLSIFCQFYAGVKLLLKIDKKSFFPVPNVDSAFVSMDFESAPQLGVLDTQLFFQLTRGGFNQRRKMLINNIKRVTGIDDADAREALKGAGIAETARAEEVSLNNFAKLSNLVYNTLRKN